MVKRPPGIFITGTDTGIGKTHVSKLLVSHFSLSMRTTYMKPVQTGCTILADGTLRAPDFDMVIGDQTLMNGSYDQHAPYRFHPACSPHFAARMAGTRISLEMIRSCFVKISTGMDLTIVEGAGGILAPLDETVYVLDLIVRLDLPALLVTSPRLGTLNHTFLTLRVLRESGVRLAGIVFNNGTGEPETPLYLENRRMLETHTRQVPFLEVPFGSPRHNTLKEFCHALYTLL